MNKSLPDNWHHIDSEVYFDGRPSAIVLLPTLVKASIGLIMAVAFCYYVSIDHRPKPGINETLLVGGSVSFLIALGYLSMGVLNWLSTRYRLTNDRIEYERGILSKTVLNVELWRVRDVYFRRSILQFFLGLGVVQILATDATIPRLEVGPIPDARRIYDQLKQARLRSGRIAGAQAMGMSKSSHEGFDFVPGASNDAG
jgi:membrane protein YdbS with pleckstrin-like domain